ncbi:phytolongin Phyl1.1-like [Zingiber officinale]|uniref:Longin domain-containing protein n=1 Tax=Zingiber officinale TaxID=94328 RepID=A0A8J5KXR9_ZINOF|nr:phytolongin Phyl1.1-like [Zingiber officinale]KAG6497037.1 hypothetical protein ZIOFF_044922 [Zingiber officinale]
MNLRRSRSVRLLSPNSPMSPPPAISTVYCCVAKGRKVIYFYNNAGQELETLAAECLQNAPVFHYWYFHTAGMRTFGFLIADGYTYFAIVDPSAGSSWVLTFLENIRAAFRKSPRNELISVIEHLVSTLKYTPRSSFLIRDDNGEGSHASPSRRSEEDEDDMVMINMPMQQELEVAPLQSLSSNRPPRSQPVVGYKLWWRHVKLIVSADIILCLVLFSIWLAACNGFHCVSK